MTTRKLMTLRCCNCRTVTTRKVAPDQIVVCPSCGSEDWPDVIEVHHG